MCWYDRFVGDGIGPALLLEVPLGGLFEVRAELTPFEVRAELIPFEVRAELTPFEVRAELTPFERHL
jgi:hypothetical protein